MRIVVVSCPSREQLQRIWKSCLAFSWPDCPFPVTVVSPENDAGWNANLVAALSRMSDDFVLLMLDDHFMLRGELTLNVNTALAFMRAHPEVAMIKLQLGNAHPPESRCAEFPRLGEYDRLHHPFKRTNLVPALYRRDWLLRLSSAVLAHIGPERDAGRNGAIEFEVTGTELTEDAARFPGRLLGIYRDEATGWRGESLLECMHNDGYREGHILEGVVEELGRMGIAACA